MEAFFEVQQMPRLWQRLVKGSAAATQPTPPMLGGRIIVSSMMIYSCQAACTPSSSTFLQKQLQWNRGCSANQKAGPHRRHRQWQAAERLSDSGSVGMETQQPLQQCSPLHKQRWTELGSPASRSCQKFGLRCWRCLQRRGYRMLGTI